MYLILTMVIIIITNDEIKPIGIKNGIIIESRKIINMNCNTNAEELKLYSHNIIIYSLDDWDLSSSKQKIRKKKYQLIANN